MTNLSSIFERLAVSSVICLLFVSCGQLNVNRLSTDNAPESIDIDQIDFSEDYSRVTCYANLLKDYGHYFTLDENYDGARIYETGSTGMRLLEKHSLHLDRVSDVTAEKFDSLGLAMVVMVDLTLPQSGINMELEALNKIRASLKNENIYISFLKSGGVVTPCQYLTDYVLSEEFIEDTNGIDKHLYAGILKMLDAADKHAGVLSSESALAVLVMSDGLVWENGQPFDKDHFLVQQKLNDYCNNGRIHLPFFYVDFSSSESVLQPTTNNTILNLCRKTGGLYQYSFKWIDCSSVLLKHFGVDPRPIKLEMSNPAGRLYNGDQLTLNVELRTPTDSVVLSGSGLYVVGDDFTTVVVNGRDHKSVFVIGIVFGLLILLSVFLVLQYIEPAVRYRKFRRTCVGKYSGQNMILNGNVVGDSCYLCKAPFREGDTVVAGCEHAMHHDCWVENGFKCPEHGSHGHDGMHYYNSSNLSDPHNASFIARWILTALVAAFLTWILSFAIATSIPSVAESLASSSDGYWSQHVVADFFFGPLAVYAAVPSLLGAFLIFSLSFLVVRHRQWWRRLSEVLLRAFVAFLSFFILYRLYLVACSYIDSDMLEWVLYGAIWLIEGLILATCLTVRTAVRPRMHLLLIFVLASLALFYVWDRILITLMPDFHLFMLFFYMVFSVGFAVCVAFASPRSYRYVLHAEGCIKTTDIALFKWFRDNPQAKVTLGRSVDCSIQLSWDIQGEVAPVHAVIFMKNSSYYLQAEEWGVELADGRVMDAGDKIKLYHSASFRIGTTTFTYSETDLY